MKQNPSCISMAMRHTLIVSALAGAFGIGSVQAAESNTNTQANHMSADAREAVVKTEEVISDSWITTKAKSEILADDVSKGFKINVKTTNGIVQLKGRLGNQDAIEHIKGIVEKIKGVRTVDVAALKVAAK